MATNQQKIAREIEPAEAGDGLRMWFNITHGFQARMLLRSEISQHLLAAGVRLIICSPNADEEYFQREFAHRTIDLVRMPHQFSKLEHQMLNVRQYVLRNPKLGETLNYKQEALKKQNPRRYCIARVLNSIFGRVSILRQGYMAAESWLFKGKEFDELLTTYRPHLMVTGTPGFDIHDVHALRSAKRLNIPTATVMLSWDNLTSKGCMNGVPDTLLVWSDLMAEEAAEYHDFRREKIHCTGAAQFDVYHHARAKVDIASWRAAHGIPANAFFMSYGTINPGICPHEIAIVKTIIAAMRQTKLSRRPYLWVRLHPQVVNGPWRRELQPFLDLAAEDVHVEVPPVHDGSLSWDLPKTDATHLMGLLASSDLCVTTSSTLSIDAACAGTPIANVFFDGCDVDPAVSVARFQRYTHYAKILSTGGIAIATTIDEFQRIMQRYCDDVSADQPDREAIIRQQIGILDGAAGRRTALKLMELARGDNSK